MRSKLVTNIHVLTTFSTGPTQTEAGSRGFPFGTCKVRLKRVRKLQHKLAHAANSSLCPTQNTDILQNQNSTPFDVRHLYWTDRQTTVPIQHITGCATWHFYKQRINMQSN